MKFLRDKIFLPAVLMAISATAYCSTAQEKEFNSLPSSLKAKVRSFQETMDANGFEVLRGNWNLFKIEDCKYAIAKFGNCFGNNPTAPYVVPTVPLWPDEYVDHYLQDAFGPTQGNTWWTHRMDEREAIVVMGTLPPPGGYFGFESYIFTRQGKLNLNDEIYRTLPDEFMKNILFAVSPNPSRIMGFASIGDSHNNVTIQRKSGAIWNQDRSFIITADAGMEKKLSEVLAKAGVYEQNQIFTEKISKDIARVGLGSSADDFITLIRYSMPFDEVLGERWRRNLPLVIYRVREKIPSHTVEPYPAQVREPRQARSDLYLQGDLNNLIKAVKQRWGQEEASDVSFQSLLLWVDLLGEHCLKRPMNCLGDTADADYQISKTVSIDDGSVIAAIGALGTATGNASYVSLSVNWLPPLVGVINQTHNDLAGSADDFAGTVANAEKFYVHYFARNCSGIANCTAISEQSLPKGGFLKIIQRNYVVPGTARGQDPKQVMNPSLIVLKPKKTNQF